MSGEFKTPQHRPLGLVSQETAAKRQAEQRLQQSDEVFRLLVESIKDYAIFLLSPNGHVETWNQGAERIKGYKADEIIGKHFSIFYPPEAAESRWPERELQMALKEGRFTDEGLRVRKDGSTFWANVVITALRDDTGVLRGFSKVTRDLSERRSLEERGRQLNKELRGRVAQLTETQRQVELRTLELQRLSTELMRVQDEERRRISRVLHDELGQHLTALKIELDLHTHPQDDLSFVRAIELADESLAKVRNLSYLLHPPLLDESGLLPALHWYIEGLEKRGGMQITFDYKPPIFNRLPREIENAIFRVLQEALTNVYRHSGSNEVRINITQESDSVTLRVRDFGKGIKEIGERGFALGVGISGMRERVKQLNGDLRVLKTEPGTIVEATIPFLDAAL